MKRTIVCLASLLCLFLLPASTVHAAPAEGELIISAAASLTNAFTEVGKKFESANPGVKAVFNFAGSGALLQQIDQGAPADVFASADQKTMDQAVEKKLVVPETRKDFAGNELVLILPAGSKIEVNSARDLTRKEIGKLSLGNPDYVPAGRYAQEFLTNEGLWEALRPKYIMGNSVRQVLDYVSRGEVDAGFVFSTDAMVGKDKVTVAMEATKHKPIAYPVATVASSNNKALAKRFADFVLSEQGQEILARYGFKKP